MIYFYTEYMDHGFAVMVKIPNHPGREAWHKWFTDEASAKKIARMLQTGELSYIHPCKKEQGMGCEFCQALTNERKQKELQHA